jgi:hypothetical protein
MRILPIKEIKKSFVSHFDCFEVGFSLRVGRTGEFAVEFSAVFGAFAACCRRCYRFIRCEVKIRRGENVSADTLYKND